MYADMYVVSLQDTRYKFLYAMMFVEHYQCHMLDDETSLLHRWTVLMQYFQKSILYLPYFKQFYQAST